MIDLKAQNSTVSFWDDDIELLSAVSFVFNTEEGNSHLLKIKRIEKKSGVTEVLLISDTMETVSALLKIYEGAGFICTTVSFSCTPGTFNKKVFLNTFNAFTLRVEKICNDTDMLAISMCSDFWTEPVFCSSSNDIRKETNLLLFKRAGKFTYLAPLVGTTHYSEIYGQNGGCCIKLTSGYVSSFFSEQPFFVLA